MSHKPETVPPQIPLVVQIGFAGSRKLVDLQAHPEVNEEEFMLLVERHLGAVLRELPRTLELSPKHFLCGVSQIAIGADTVFTKACEEHCIRQRIFLPQHRDEYFKAWSEGDPKSGRKGERDFSDAEVQQAERLLRSTHIIETRTVSQSAVRKERFEEVNLELVRVSDVLIALQRANPDGKPGGTGDFIERARARHKPLLEITVSVRNGKPFFAEKWHANNPTGEGNGALDFKPPGLPSVLNDCLDATAENYADVLKDFAGKRAKGHQGRFIWAAMVIVGTHFAATVCSVLGQSVAKEATHENHAVMWLLGAEALLLLTGFCYHFWLHHSNAAKHWAVARLVSEVARSVTAVKQVPGYLSHLFTLPLPEFLRPLMRTLNVFHLEATNNLDPAGWKDRRLAYVRNRLTKPDGGQISYYTRQRDKAHRWLRVANCAFYVSSVLALIATLWEFFFECRCDLGAGATELREWHHHLNPLVAHAPAFMAITFPVLSVAAMSLAASFDLEARKHTYAEMIRALEQQKDFIEGAKSEHEFMALVLQTETRLVGENVNWFSRRTFTGVA